VVTLLAISLGINVAAIPAIVWLLHTHYKIQMYAWEMSDELPVADRASIAYRDMASVIGLGGRCPKKDWSRL
jgi:hypothetical protein